MILFPVNSALLVKHGVAVKARGDLLLEGGTGQHVPRDLLDSKLLERHILVECLDHPVSKLPGSAPVVCFVPVGVGVACQIQPGTRPALAIVRGTQQPVHQLLVGIWTLIRKKGVHLLDCWGHANQVKRDSPDKGFLVSFRRG